MTDHETGSSDRDLTAVEELLLALTPEDLELVEPPPDLWDRIQADAGIAVDGSDAAPAAGTGPATDGTAVEGVERPAALIPLRRGRRLPAPRTLLGAAAAVVLVVLGLVVLDRRDADESLLVASAELTYEPGTFDPLGADATARASLIDVAGHLQVEIDESGLPRLTGQAADLELWLIEPDDEGNPAALVSLGLIDPAGPDRFDIPPGYDPDAFFVVDISVEPRDGDDAHSGRSILRGPLTRV